MITLPQFPLSFAIMALEYTRLSWGLFAAGGCLFFLYINFNNLMGLDLRNRLSRELLLSITCMIVHY